MEVSARAVRGITKRVFLCCSDRNLHELRSPCGAETRESFFIAACSSMGLIGVQLTSQEK